MLKLIKTCLSLRSLPAILALAAMALTAPALLTGWQLDDYAHRVVIAGPSQLTGPRVSGWEIFSLANGDPVRNRWYMDTGVLPWWTFENLRIAFWRPLSVLTHRIDYLLWPDTAALMHLHSLFWFGLVISTATVFYRRLMTGPLWVGGLAALLYAVNDAHGIPAGWLANRNALLATFFSLMALLAHDAWRRQGWRPGAVLGPLGLAAGLLAGEVAAGAAAYFIAYEFFIERGSLQRRLAGLLPYAIVLAVWWAGYHGSGFGTGGSDYYIDPVAEPVLFSAALIERLPILLLGMWGLPPSGIYVFLSAPEARFMWYIALLFLLLSATALGPLLLHDRRSRFWCFGMLLSLVPVCTTIPHDRLLMLAGLGGMGLLATITCVIVSRPAWAVRNRKWFIFSRGMVFLLFFINAFLSPLLLSQSSRMFARIQRFVSDAAKDIPAGPAFSRQDLVLINPPIPFFAMFITSVRMLAHQPCPQHLRILAPGLCPLQMTRRDEKTLVIRPAAGYLSAPFDTVFRGKRQAMKVGQKVGLSGMKVEITALTEDGRPAEAAFTFNVPLEDSSLLWMHWKDGAYRLFEVPPVGETITVPAAAQLKAVLF